MEMADSSPRRFVILAAPRTGSNWLCTLLDSHPEVLCHHEIFNPEGIHFALPFRGGEIDLGSVGERDGHPLRALERLWRRPLGFPVVGFKLNRGQSPEALTAVIDDVDIRKIVLRRGNRIKTFVSERLSQKTGEWESYPGIEIDRRKPRIEIELDDLLEHVATNQRYYRQIEKALEAGGQQALEITYEELHTNEERQRILRFLGVAPEAVLQGATRKQNSKDLRDLVANFETLALELRGSELEAELLSKVA